MMASGQHRHVVLLARSSHSSSLLQPQLPRNPSTTPQLQRMTHRCLPLYLIFGPLLIAAGPVCARAPAACQHSEGRLEGVWNRPAARTTELLQQLDTCSTKQARLRGGLAAERRESQRAACWGVTAWECRRMAGNPGSSAATVACSHYRSVQLATNGRPYLGQHSVHVLNRSAAGQCCYCLRARVRQHE